MSAEITLFVNPAAGRGRGAHAAQPAAAALRAAG
ncbi:sphingosine kinase, partial [Streptomyces toxytricini]